MDSFVSLRSIAEHVLFCTWSFVHLIDQAFAECQRSPVHHAVGPALADSLEEKRLGPCSLHSELGQLKDALCSRDRRPFTPARDGQRNTMLDRGKYTEWQRERYRESWYTDNNKWRNGELVYANIRWMKQPPGETNGSQLPWIHQYHITI